MKQIDSGLGAAVALLAAAGLVLLSAGEGRAAFIVLDHFADPDGLVDPTMPHAVEGFHLSPDPGSGFEALATSSAVGGSREMRAIVTAGSGSLAVTVDAGNSGVLRFSASPDTRGLGYLVYDGGADGNFETNGLGGLDLLSGGSDGFHFNILSSNKAGGSILVRVWDAGEDGYYSEASFAVPAGTGMEQWLGPDQFSDDDLTAAEILSNAGAIELIVTASEPGWEFELGPAMAATPEPSRALLGLFGLLGSVAWGRRRRA